ncbi:unnamed protein product [Discula destructiva]
MDDGTCTAPSGEKPYSFGTRPKVLALIVAPIIAALPALVIWGIPAIWAWVGVFLGGYLRRKTEGRHGQVLKCIEEDEQSYAEKHKAKSGGSGDSKKENWSGIVGIFHPFCNAGGGGERVLWVAIRAIQAQYPKARIVVYTGDHEVNKEQILARVQNRFNIDLHEPTIQFMYLNNRSWVLASSWPQFTLAFQSIGSLVLGWEAFSIIIPDIFIDTMGYAFTLGLCKWLFPNVPTGAYVHYPMISTDMIQNLAVGGQGINAGKGAGLKGKLKLWYWQLLAWLYKMMGSTIDVVMTNSTWTQAHISDLWGQYRRDSGKTAPIVAVWPPCPVEELEEKIQVSAESEALRTKTILYIAQYRPEKNHELIIRAFTKFVKSESEASKDAKLVLVGSVRDGDDSKRVYALRLLSGELQMKERIEFQTDVPFSEILKLLQTSSVGVNGMWNEHFGIGVVEYQASGLISVVHDSGGPKLDIVTKIDGEPTGFHASTVEEFAEGFEQALSVPDPIAMRIRARRSAKRFGEVEFQRKWLLEMDKLVDKAAK